MLSETLLHFCLGGDGSFRGGWICRELNRVGRSHQGRHIEGSERKPTDVLVLFGKEKRRGGVRIALFGWLQLKSIHHGGGESA